MLRQMAAHCTTFISERFSDYFIRSQGYRQSGRHNKPPRQYSGRREYKEVAAGMHAKNATVPKNVRGSDRSIDGLKGGVAYSASESLFADWKPATLFNFL